MFGNATLTQVARYFANVFNCPLDLGNLSRAFCDMKIRNDPTPPRDISGQRFGPALRKPFIRGVATRDGTKPLWEMMVL